MNCFESDIFAWKIILFAFRFDIIANLVEVYGVKCSRFYLAVWAYQFAT